MAVTEGNPEGGCPPGRRNGAYLIPALVILLACSMLVGVGVGAVTIPLREIAAISLRQIPFIGGLGDLLPEPEPMRSAIITQIRLPRVVLAGLVGAALAVAGATFQGLFRNPMADPFVIGASSGASLGAALAIILGTRVAFLGPGSIPIMAFLGAMMAILLVYNLSRVGNRMPVLTMLLAGIAVGSFLSALVSLVVYFAGQQIHQVVFWLMGGFSGAGWRHVKMAVPYVLLGSVVSLAYARDLNAIVLGEETALHLGVEIERVKRILLASASLLTATAVSTSGLIGFVGLIIPHVVRLLSGPDHRLVIPASALAGATFLVGADVLARTIISPTELPVGILTSLLGGPFFIYLLRRRKNLAYFGSRE